MYYVIRILAATNTKILIGHADMPSVKAFETKEEAEARRATVPGRVVVLEFESDAQARMYLDPAAQHFRCDYESKLAAKLAA